MKLCARISLCFALFVTIAPLAAHADTVNFSAAGNGFQSAGTLTYIQDPSHTGVFDVTAITGEVNGVNITGLLPGSYSNSNPSYNSNNSFGYDNLLYASSPILDYWGLGFSIGNSGYNGNFYSQNGYNFLDSNGINTHLTSFSVTQIVPPTPIVPTPEPSSLFLMGTGLAGFATAVRRRLKA